MAVGGQYTVRGYRENALIGDIGLLFKNELRSPSFEVFLRRSAGRSELKDELQCLLFLDTGWVAEVDKNIATTSKSILASAGPGMRYKINNYLDMRFDFGMQLKYNKQRLIGNGRRYRGHFFVQLSY